MADLREIWAWFFLYLIFSFFALTVAVFSLHYFWPSYDTGEQSSGPIEQQFYLLLVDRGYWMTGFPRDAEFSDGMTREGRASFFHLLNDIRFRADCLSGEEKQVGLEMACAVNGEDINFVPYD